ncbi:hypothetical protein PGTUg99_009870 [Puccinia graminis f. sp. tritici]|uniref:Uncharacterized protein n=1 Tax=Puccinia graminis f. sp. tritici TaxID=56615 RepID=A0A5B0S9I7_PUCGR|nr:hypothetical protein PGTUg99_009870 [Puccinia graminis f. sp. tritici]
MPSERLLLQHAVAANTQFERLRAGALSENLASVKVDSVRTGATFSVGFALGQSLFGRCCFIPVHWRFMAHFQYLLRKYHLNVPVQACQSAIPTLREFILCSKDQKVQ